jgi:acyl carrier protein
MHIVEPTKTFSNSESLYKSFFHKEETLVSVKPYQGRDFSSLSGIFPGQGVIFEGQFSEWLKGKSRFRDFFQQADAWSNSHSLPRPSLYLTAPQRIIPPIRVKIKNLALFTLEVALFEELSRLGLQFKRLASYSFGEYAGWVACGSIPFQQMLEVVYWREELSPPVNELGAMVLVGASENQLRTALADVKFFIANQNLPEQTIIACDGIVADQVVKTLFAQRITCQRLSELAQPYHSPLMAGIAAALAEKIEQVKLEISAPRIPLFSSVLNQWISAENFDRSEIIRALSRQLCETVNFMTISSGLELFGPQSFIELGPGASCAQLLSKIDKNSTFHQLPLGKYIRGDFTKIKEFTEKTRQSKFVSVVSSVIAQLTGYEVTEITIEDRFQEDLGIDSLKKAEIVFEVLHKADFQIDDGLNTSRFQALGDLVEYLDAGPLPTETRTKTALETPPFERFQTAWVPQVKQLHLASEDKLTIHHFDIQKIISGSENGSIRHALIEAIEMSDAPNGSVICLACPNVDVPCDAVTLTHLVSFWRDFFMELPEREFRVALVGNENGFLFSGLNVFFQSLVKEFGTFVLLPVACADSAANSRPDDAWLSTQIQRPRLVERRFSQAECKEKSWKRCPRVPGNHGQFTPKRMAWLGGCGGVGFELLSRCPHRHEVELHVIGRKPQTDITVQDRLGMLELDYKAVHYYQVDGTEKNQLHQILDQIERSHGKIELVVNAAGVDHSSVLKQKIDAEIADEIHQKLTTASNIERWCSSRDSIQSIHFSSMVSQFGNHGQSVYALANACMSAALAQQVSSSSLVIHWPAWQNVGMTARPSVRVSLAESGIQLMKPDEGGQLFWEDVAARTSGEATYLNTPLLATLLLHTIQFSKVYDIVGYIPQRARSRRIEKVFHSHQDPYLVDHSFHGKHLVPAATVLLMFMEISYLLTGEFQPIVDFEMLNLMIVDESGLPVNIAIAPKRSGEMQWLIRSLPIFARCRVEEFGAVAKAAPPRIEARPEESKQRMESQNWYSTGMLFHGPRLQILHDTWKIDAECLRARVNLDRLPTIYGKGFFDVLMPVIDGFFQLSAINHFLERQLKVLPVGLQRLDYHPSVEWGRHLWIQVDTSDAGATCDFPISTGYVFNDRREIILELTGATFREAGSALATGH